MKKNPFALLLGASAAVAIFGAPADSVAADAAAGKVKAQACAGCHGLVGLSMVPDTPSLAGQPEVYLVNQLRAFRSGERRHEVMSLIAKPLTDGDIADLSAWFAAIRVDAKAPG